MDKTHSMYIAICIVINQLLNGRVCFNLEETTSKKRLQLKENMLHIGSIFVPLKVATMRIENIFKGH